MVNKVVNQEELSAIGIETPKENTVLYYDKAGNLCEADRAVAKSVEFQAEEGKTPVTVYYVKHGRGQVFDPYGIDMHKTNAYNFQFKKVDTSVYSKYIKYLKTRRQLFLTHAQREFINKGY